MGKYRKNYRKEIIMKTVSNIAKQTGVSKSAVHKN